MVVSFYLKTPVIFAKNNIQQNSMTENWVMSYTMDVLNKFKSTLQSSVSSTVFTTVSSIKDVLPGNPVTREYEVHEHIASAGPG